MGKIERLNRRKRRKYHQPKIENTELYFTGKYWGFCERVSVGGGFTDEEYRDCVKKRYEEMKEEEKNLASK